MIFLRNFLVLTTYTLSCAAYYDDLPAVDYINFPIDSLVSEDHNRGSENRAHVNLQWLRNETAKHTEKALKEAIQHGGQCIYQRYCLAGRVELIFRSQILLVNT